MRRLPLLRTLVAVAALALLTGPARAVLYSGSYTVSNNNNPNIGLAVGEVSDFGLFVSQGVVGNQLVSTNSFSNLSLSNAPGTTFTTDLFELFAAESEPFSGNDLVPQPISVAFNFTGPSVFSGTINGTTVGILGDDATVHWLNSFQVRTSGGTINIALTDAPFADFFNGVVQATITVPEPDSLALFGIALVGVVALGRRKVARA